MYPFAIIAPQIGARSETFIRRHIEQILPNQTVVVAGDVSSSYTGHWSVNCPVLARNPSPRHNNFKEKVRVSEAKIAVAHFLKKNKIKVIMGEFLHYSFSSFQIAQKLNIPFFAHAHGIDVSQVIRDPNWQKKYLYYQQAAGVITISKFSKNRLLNLGLSSDKVHIIPSGVDVPNQPVQRLTKKQIRCLAVGRMVGKKAPILLLESFRQAAQEYPNLRLDYVGTGELLPAVKQFIHAFQLENHVTLHQGQPNQVVRELMKNADIFIQHSITDPDTGDEEGLPVSILEAMSLALPIVSTNHAGIPEAVVEGETGFLVKEGDCLQMAKQILLLAQNPDLRLNIGFAGWERANNLFTWERERKQLIQVMGLDKYLN